MMTTFNPKLIVSASVITIKQVLVSVIFLITVGVVQILNIKRLFLSSPPIPRVTRSISCVEPTSYPILDNDDEYWKDQLEKASQQNAIDNHNEYLEYLKMRGEY